MSCLSLIPTEALSLFSLLSEAAIKHVQVVFHPSCESSPIILLVLKFGADLLCSGVGGVGVGVIIPRYCNSLSCFLYSAASLCNAGFAVRPFVNQSDVTGNQSRVVKTWCSVSVLLFFVFCKGLLWWQRLSPVFWFLRCYFWTSFLILNRICFPLSLY